MVEAAINFPLFNLFRRNQQSSVRDNEKANWNYTQSSLDYARHTRFYEEKQSGSTKEALYMGRHIIKRDSPINKGVYFVGGLGESIVVDDEKDEFLQGSYKELIKWMRTQQSQRRLYVDEVIDHIWKNAMDVMPYDGNKVDDFVYKMPINQKVCLGEFSKNGRCGAAVCRHQGLYCAYLLEKLISEKYFGGKVSVDRNYVQGVGGHAWTRYTTYNGRVIIIDPAQRYCGSLDAVPKDRWFYQRPGERNPVVGFWNKIKKALFL